MHIMRFEIGQPDTPFKEDLVNHIWIHVGNNPVTNPVITPCEFKLFTF
jgi:hypothetical protein